MTSGMGHLTIILFWGTEPFKNILKIIERKTWDKSLQTAIICPMSEIYYKSFSSSKREALGRFYKHIQIKSLQLSIMWFSL